jgi:phage recombination protein Bet
MSNIVPAQKSQTPMIADEQIKILRDTVFKELSEPEMKFAVQVCNRTGLDPFVRQIHFVKRWNEKKGQNEIAIQTGIDGFRLQAQRTGEYAGSDDVVFDNEDSPTKATVTVYRIVQGNRCAYTATARWKEFYPGDKQGFMWKAKPCVMLGKCAEAQALRKAFPAELSGFYTPEEMESPNHVEREPKTHALTDPDDELKQKLTETFNKFKKLGVTEEMLRTKFAHVTEPAEALEAMNSLGADIKNKRTTVEIAFSNTSFGTEEF